ncbi:MAG TPA: putative glycoside hydrolase [Candidatus Paceibacterota bacterium]
MQISRHFSKLSKLKTKNTIAFFGSFLVLSFFTFFIWNSSKVVLYSQDQATSVALVGAPRTTGTVVPLGENNPPPPPELPPPQHIKTPDAVRAVYMTSWVAGTASIRDPLLSFVENSEINSIVIDVKDYSGKMSFEVDNSVVDAMQSEEKRIPDMRAFIDRLHQKNIYVIARITVFQDPQAARMRSDLAVKNKNGGLWKDKNGLAYIDPGAKDFWAYIVEMSRVSERVGFDEINFDYIRFPSDGQIALAVFPFQNGRAKADVLEDFFKYLRGELKDLSVPISADVFGLTTYADDDLNIGQVLERTAPYFDYIAPMVYPSHYASGFGGFKNPAEYPYEVIFKSMSRGIEKLKAMGEDAKKFRPWIQDFDLGTNYGIAEVNKQKQALYDLGIQSWMAWDPSNNYTKPAYKH